MTGVVGGNVQVSGFKEVQVEGPELAKVVPAEGVQEPAVLPQVPLVGGLVYEGEAPSAMKVVVPKAEQEPIDVPQQHHVPAPQAGPTAQAPGLEALDVLVPEGELSPVVLPRIQLVDGSVDIFLW